MISLHGTVRARDRMGERDDATATAAKARATVATTMGVRVICPFYTFGRPHVPAPDQLDRAEGGRLRRLGQCSGMTPDGYRERL